MEKGLSLNKLFIGTIGTVITSKISMKDFQPCDISILNPTLLYIKYDKCAKPYYTDLNSSSIVSL